MSIFRFLLLILCSFPLLILRETLFAADGSCDELTFECYQKNVELYCKNEYSPWNTGQNFGKITDDYVALNSQAQNTLAENLINTEQNQESKAYLMNMLDQARLGAFEGFRTVEIARIMYRNNMNRIFSCAVTAGRVDKLQKLIDLAQRFGARGSDIKEKLDREKKRYERTMSTMNCNQNTNSTTNSKIVDKLARSATLEYCQYSFYLSYLDTNIRNNYSQVLKIESQIGNPNTSKAPTNTEQALQKLNSRTNLIGNERGRAQMTLPKALVTYREMERTYTVHLLLVIIFDDYLQLRDSLKSYMNAFSQTFEKAFNAQDKNSSK